MNNTKWILLAEDNPKDADLTIRALRTNGSPGEVILARDGSEVLDCLHRRGAFEALNHGPPALVLLDLKMPKVDGLEVLRQIKADAGLKAIPVVVFSSSFEESDLARAYQLGTNAYVVKPVDFTQFVSALNGIRAFWLALNEPPPEGLNRNVNGTKQRAFAV
jgi:CheY-like chemotaxis protein